MMKWLSIFLIPVLCLLLAGCGFHPVYGDFTHDNDGRPVDEQLAKVQIQNIPDRNGQVLRNHLIDRMYAHGRPDQPLYTLTVKLTANESDIGIQSNGSATRKELNLRADYKLMDLAGKQLTAGQARSIISYAELDAQYGTLAGQQNAYANALTEVGEQIVNRLSLYFAERAPDKSEPPVIKPDTTVPPDTRAAAPL